jgi:hypothetical protein
MYIDITDPASTQHRLFFDKKSIYGHENVMMNEEKDSTIRQGMLGMLIQKIQQNPLSGQWGNYSWKSVS